MSVGIAKSQLAQHIVKLVGEYVGRDVRSLDPEIIRAIKKRPSVNTPKDPKAFLGTATTVRDNAGPAYARTWSTEA